jgi:hypothetical protein
MARLQLQVSCKADPRRPQGQGGRIGLEFAKRASWIGHPDLRSCDRTPPLPAIFQVYIYKNQDIQIETKSIKLRNFQYDRPAVNAKDALESEFWSQSSSSRFWGSYSRSI